MTPDVPAEVIDGAREWLARTPGDLSPHRVAEALRAAGRPIGDATVLAVYELLRRDVLGAGPLEPLLHLDGVTDVLVNGPDRVFVDRGSGLEPEPAVRFADDASVRRLAQRLAAGAGRRLDDAAPAVDARLRDGTRFHAVLAPVARPGTAISLRLPARHAFSFADLVDTGMVAPELAEVLRDVVLTGLAFLVSGGTGSGKTTLLAALLGLVPADRRIVIVEDSTELRPDHPHVVGLEGRPPNLEGAGALEMRTLVRQALRMRPDRLVVGEVRGAEVTDLLAALNTGHEGGCGTVHANASADVPARIEALALAAGLDRAAAHSQLVAGVDVLVHVRRHAGDRRVAELAVLTRGRDGLAEVVPALTVGAQGEVIAGVGLATLRRRLEARR